MGILGWIKKHPIEAAAIGTGIVLTGGALGVGPAAGIMGGAGAAGAGAAGAGAAAGSPALLGAGVGGASLGAEAAMGLAGSPALLGAGVGGASLGADAIAASMAGSPSLLGAGAEGVSLGAEAAAGGGSLMPTPGSNLPFELTPDKAMKLAQVMGSGQQQPQRQLGAPMETGSPMQRPAMASQEDIMKKWLQRNDPRTYARLYGAPPGAMA